MKEQNILLVMIALCLFSMVAIVFYFAFRCSELSKENTEIRDENYALKMEARKVDSMLSEIIEDNKTFFKNQNIK